MRNHYTSYNSLTIKTRVALIMMVVLPYLLMVYFYLNEQVSMAGSIIFVIPVVLFSILAGFSLIRNSADQLALLEEQTHQASKSPGGCLVNHAGDAEMNDIAGHFNALVGNLQSLDISFKDQSVQLMKYAHDMAASFQAAREERDLRNRLSRYVGSHVVESLVAAHRTPFDTNTEKIVTVLFADIRSFTTLAESLSAKEVVALLNDFFERMVAVAFAHHAILDKFVGDQLMAVFGILPGSQDPAVHAVHAAVAMQRETARLVKQRRREGKQTFSIGIGINTGDVILGNIGCENRMDFTVIGDPVNVAARLQAMAKGGQVIIGEATRKCLDAGVRVVPCGEVRLRNRSRPVNYFKVTGIQADRPESANRRPADARCRDNVRTIEKGV
jgi:adenylate cyclase